MEALRPCDERFRFPCLDVIEDSGWVMIFDRDSETTIGE